MAKRSRFPDNCLQCKNKLNTVYTVKEQKLGPDLMQKQNVVKLCLDCKIVYVNDKLYNKWDFKIIAKGDLPEPHWFTTEMIGVVYGK